MQPSVCLSVCLVLICGGYYYNNKEHGICHANIKIKLLIAAAMGNIMAAAATGGERPAAAREERRGSDYAERYNNPNRQSQTEHFGQLTNNEVSTTNYVVRWYRMLVHHLQRLRGVEVAEVSTEVNVGHGKCSIDTLKSGFVAEYFGRDQSIRMEGIEIRRVD